MTALADDVTVSPETAVPDVPEIVTRVTQRLNAFQERMILARRLTLGTDNVRSEALCHSGVNEFLTRGHLVASKSSRHPRHETERQAAQAENEIRAWVVDKLGGELEDFTPAGLERRLPRLIAVEEKWATEFRDLIIRKYNENYIHLDRMQEVLPQLGLEPHRPALYVELSAYFDFRITAPADAQRQAELPERLRRELHEALVRIAGPDVDYSSSRYGANADNPSSYVQASVVRAR